MKIKVLLLLLTPSFGYCCFNKEPDRPIKVTDKEKQDILNLHNLMRHCVATGETEKECSNFGIAKNAHRKAQNMKKMYSAAQEIGYLSNLQKQYLSMFLNLRKWDDSLTKLAGVVTRKTNDLKRIQDSRFPCLGNNIAFYQSNKVDPDFLPVIRMWFNEQKSYNYSTEWLHETVGHYLQIVWADSYLIGCDYEKFQNEGPYNYIYVCIYAPCGNVYDEYVHWQLPYVSGPPSCERFNMTLSDIPGLCNSS